MTFKKLHCLLNFITSFQTFKNFFMFCNFWPTRTHQKYHPDIDIFGLVLWISVPKILNFGLSHPRYLPKLFLLQNSILRKFEWTQKLQLVKFIFLKSREIGLRKDWNTYIFLEFTLKNTGENFLKLSRTK